MRMDDAVIDLHCKGRFYYECKYVLLHLCNICNTSEPIEHSESTSICTKLHT